jgi:hypothetical protein
VALGLFAAGAIHTRAAHPPTPGSAVSVPADAAAGGFHPSAEYQCQGGALVLPFPGYEDQFAPLDVERCIRKQGVAAAADMELLS